MGGDLVGGVAAPGPVVLLVGIGGSNAREVRRRQGEADALPPTNAAAVLCLDDRQACHC